MEFNKFMIGIHKPNQTTSKLALSESDASDPQGRPATLPLDQIDEENDYNPRLTDNPRYEEIKESIRARGVDTPVSVSQPPGAQLYIRVAGGKTRTKALRELLEETGNVERFGHIPVVIKPWRSKLDVAIGHATENVRSGINFYEHACSERHIYHLICADEPTFANSSLQERSDKYLQLGHKIDRTYLSLFEYIFHRLIPSMESQLLGGMQIRTVKSLRAIESKKALQLGDNPSQKIAFNKLMTNVIKRYADGSELNLDDYARSIQAGLDKITANSASTDNTTKTDDNQAPNQHTQTTQLSAAADNSAPVDSNDIPSPSVLTNSGISVPQQEASSSPQPEPKHDQISAGNHAEETHERINELRNEGTSIALQIASETGLVGGSFITLPDYALGFGVENIDNVKSISDIPTPQAYCIFLQMHSIFWAAYELDVKYERIDSQHIKHLSDSAEPHNILNSPSYREATQFTFDQLRMLAATGSLHDGGTDITNWVINIDKLRTISWDYAQAMVKLHD